MTDYRGKQIVIIGLGYTGLSCIDFFLSHGVTPRVMDTRLSPPGLNKLPDNIECWLGSLNEQWLLAAMLIVTSPGVALSHPALVAAAQAKVEIISDIELFAREVKAPVIAITGSNGKSTVTQLVREMATLAGWHVGVGGNIGLPALMLLDKCYHLYVLELSSFQLETTHSLHAAAATILNISTDHMDRYPLGLQQYRAAKLEIYRNAKTCVINIDDVLTMPVLESNSEFISFGFKSGDYHLCYQNGQTWLMAYNKPLLNCAEMKINGYHNYTNALAALALANAVTIPSAACLAALCQFNGLKHRFELVYERNGVRWINDSKSTNIGSTEAALNSLTVTGTLHLLLGGDSKSADLSPLVHLVQRSQVKLYCFGRDGARLSSLRPSDATLTATLEQAMRIIGNLVKEGDVVLLSPACASLDQFKNFEVRGDIFTQLAWEIG